MTPKSLSIKDIPTPFSEGSIVETANGVPVSFENLTTDLAGVRIVYVGEQHTSAAHHEIQLTVIKAIYKKHPDISIGMEMFDVSYQEILDQWSAGKLDRKEFLEKVHWYANWKFDYDLYADILNFIKEKKIKLVGLNIPFHIPPRIREGGIENLSGDDKKYLPGKIDASDAAHKAYVETIFKTHHFSKRVNFDYFYMAQCVWEDTMAESIARNLKEKTMIVLAGNGHIVRKFGIPDRTFQRTGASFRTIYLAPGGSEVERDFADYIWVTPTDKKRKK
ncbi:MAG: ChaN family lipoprotein [Pseudomonadota bacterium]